MTDFQPLDEDVVAPVPLAIHAELALMKADVVSAKRHEIAIVPMTDGDDGGLTGTGNTLACRLPVDPGLNEQGWEWRCNADAAKLDQVVDSYRELGFEVRLEPINLNGLAAGYGGCKSALLQSNVVFVRPKGRL